MKHKNTKRKDQTKETLGSHSRDPVPGDDDNETPRQGIGNQDQGTPQHMERSTVSLTTTTPRT